ncbi:VOC family protein [soil metagenome]
MNTNWKPADHNSLSPYLMVADAEATIAFATEVFGAVEIARHPGPGGRIMHAELRFGDSVLMLAQASSAWPALPVHLHLYVSDVDACHARAIAAGARSLQEPVRKGDPDRRGGFVAPDGIVTWWVATHSA